MRYFCAESSSFIRRAASPVSVIFAENAWETCRFWSKAAFSSASACDPQAISIRVPPRKLTALSSLMRPISPVAATWVPQQAQQSYPGISTIRTGHARAFFER